MENYRYFLKNQENEWKNEESFYFGRKEIVRVAISNLETEYYIGGLYDVEKIDDWISDGKNPDEFPSPVADINSWETEETPEKEFYEVETNSEGKILSMVKVRADEQPTVTYEVWWNGSNLKKREIENESEGLNDDEFNYEVTDEIISFDEIWNNHTGQGYGHDEIWVAVDGSGNKKFYNRPVSYMQGDDNERFFELTEEEAEKMMNEC